MNLFQALQYVGDGRQVYRRTHSGAGIAMKMVGDRLIFGVVSFYSNLALIVDYRLGQADLESVHWATAKGLEWETVAMLGDRSYEI
jgi:hypothetical protein